MDDLAMEDFMARPKVEAKEEWMKWVKEIPALSFKAEWKVKIIPPFAGAIARFHIDNGDKHVSVYLDCYDKLGIFGEPYWEIYPYEDDIYRVAMNNTEELMEKISEVVDS